MRAAAVLLSVVALATVAHAVVTNQLPPFSSVQVCTPFNVAVAPSKGNTYGVTIDGDSSVAPTVDAAVNSGVLTLGSKGSFTTQKPIKVTVSLPASKLAAVTVSSAAGIVVVVETGFSVGSFSGLVRGAGDLLVRNLRADSIKLVNSETGNLVFSGAAKTATVQSTGTGTAYVSGVSGQVDVTGDGTGEILVHSATNALKITGKVEGISSLTYNQGVCTAQDDDLGKACIQRPVRAPAVKEQWTCGLQLSGTFGCSSGSGSSSSQGGGASGSTFTSSSGGGSSSASSSSNSGGGGSFFSSSSSNGDGTVSTNSVPEQSGQSTLTTNTGKLSTQKCSVASSALKISRK